MNSNLNDRFQKISTVTQAYRLGFDKSFSIGGYPAVYLLGTVDGALGVFRSDNSGSSWTRINDDNHQFGWVHQVTGDPRVYGRCYIFAEGHRILYGEPAGSDTTNNPTTFGFFTVPSDSVRQAYKNITVQWSKVSVPQSSPLKNLFKRSLNKMNRAFLFCLVFIFLPLNLFAQTVVLTGRTDNTPVMGGEYTVMNNVWGSTTDVQYLSVNTNETSFKVTQSSANNTGGSPASYPFIYKGCHFGSCTSNPITMMINQIKSAPFIWSISTAGVLGNWDCSYESWFDIDGTSNNHSAELMIWINYQGSIGPGGSQVGSVSIGGYTWNIYYAPAATWGWNYIAYKITSPTDSVSLDFKDFIRDAASRGYLYTSWYLNNMEAGFEIWTNGTGLTTNSYSASVIGGASDTNYAPTPFALTSPANKANLSSMTITFKWQPSIDPDKNNLDYILHLSGPNVDTTITDIYNDTLSFNGNNYLQSLTTYSWYVQATDGTDTTVSTTIRTFKTPNAVDVNIVNQIPVKYWLGQNYPNPFNPQTTISYSLPIASSVTLKVYDFLGREITTLMDNERKSAGNYEILFDASNLSSGVYFYKLSVISTGLKDRFVETKQMELIK